MLTRASLSHFLFLWLFLAFTVSSVVATPLLHSSSTSGSVHLERRNRYILQNDTVTGTLRVLNPLTQQPVPQGPATDGAGSGLNAPAILWAVSSLLVGLPLCLAGIRGWRFTIGAGIGVAAAVLSWAAFVNTVDAGGLSDLALALIVHGFMLFGFSLGYFDWARIAGMITIGVMGGMSFGVRLMLLREGLLFHTGNDGSGAGYTLGWLLITFFGFLGGGLVSWVVSRRTGMLFSCASIGTFLVSLGLDIFVNNQAGMSRGLIFLFDRNSSHILDLLQKGYHPTTSTIAFVAASLILTPFLALVQHIMFRIPFDRRYLPEDGPDNEPAMLEDDWVQVQPFEKNVTYKGPFGSFARANPQRNSV